MKQTKPAQAMELRSLSPVFCGRLKGREARLRSQLTRSHCKRLPSTPSECLEQASRLRHADACVSSHRSYRPVLPHRVRQITRWGWAIACIVGGAWLLIGSFGHWWAAGFPPQERAQWHGALGNIFFAAAIGVAAIGVFGVRALRPRNEATVARNGGP